MWTDKCFSFGTAGFVGTSPIYLCSFHISQDTGHDFPWVRYDFVRGHVNGHIVAMPKAGGIYFGIDHYVTVHAVVKLTVGLCCVLTPHFAVYRGWCLYGNFYSSSRWASRAVYNL